MSFTRMRYHFVTATKERKRWLNERVQAFVRGAMRQRAEAIGGKVIAAGGIEDHEHIVAAVPPEMAPADFIGRLKAHSSRRLRGEFHTMPYFEWQEGYGGFTLRADQMGDVIEYVENQESHHRRGKIWERLEKVG